MAVKNVDFGAFFGFFELDFTSFETDILSVYGKTDGRMDESEP